MNIRKRFSHNNLKTINDKHKQPSAPLVFEQIEEDGGKYHFFANGDWKYMSDDMTIEYYKEAEGYKLSLADENRMVEVENLRKILSRAKAQSKKLF